MRLSWLLLIALPCCTPPPQSNVSPGEASQRHYALGADYFQKQMIPAALGEAQEALKLDPKNHEALYLIGMISMRQAVETVELMSRARCLPPDEAKLEREDADQKMARAEGSFRKAVAVKADYAEAWNAISAAALHFRRWDQAIEAADRALSNGTYVSPWIAMANRGIAFFEKKDYLRASQALRQAIAQNARFCVARWRLAEVYHAQGDDERSIAELQMVVTDKNCPIQEAHLLMGKILQKRQEPDRAREMFRQCLRLAPESCVAKECRLEN